jgi:uncharacterized repeat protein (TIGR03803 family)
MVVQATSPESERKTFRARKWILCLASAAAIFAVVIVALLVTRSERYEVIQTFAAVGRGAKTPMGLAVDKAGNLYGSTWTGGPGRWGTIFELTPPSFFGSRWEMRVLSDASYKTIGGGPFWSMIAQNGDLYGATSDGGVQGGGTLYKFQFNDHGWGEPTPLFHFAGHSSPDDMVSELISDSSGSLYGTTKGAGGRDAGTVFKLSLGPDGWTMTILHRFSGDNDDGAYPMGGLTMDKTGALYGTTNGGGGKWGVGTVFKLTPTDHGWDETLIYTFIQKPGYFGDGGLLPMAGLTLGDDGTLYGTTGGGGKFGEGVVFSLTPSESNGWSEHVLYHFKREVGEGSAPNSRLVFGQSGALYGTTKFGGDAPGYSGLGTVFKLIPTATGWSEIVLHRFMGGADGAQPTGRLIRDQSGSMFGTTVGVARNGVYNDGTVFEIVAGGLFGR